MDACGTRARPTEDATFKGASRQPGPPDLAHAFQVCLSISRGGTTPPPIEGLSGLKTGQPNSESPTAFADANLNLHQGSWDQTRAWNLQSTKPWAGGGVGSHESLGALALAPRNAPPFPGKNGQK